MQQPSQKLTHTYPTSHRNLNKRTKGFNKSAKNRCLERSVFLTGVQGNKGLLRQHNDVYLRGIDRGLL